MDGGGKAAEPGCDHHRQAWIAAEADDSGGLEAEEFDKAHQDAAKDLKGRENLPGKIRVGRGGRGAGLHCRTGEGPSRTPPRANPSCRRGPARGAAPRSQALAPEISVRQCRPRKARWCSSRRPPQTGPSRAFAIGELRTLPGERKRKTHRDGNGKK